MLEDDLAMLADEGDDSASDSDDGEAAAEARQRLERENFGKRQADGPS